MVSWSATSSILVGVGGQTCQSHTGCWSDHQQSSPNNLHSQSVVPQAAHVGTCGLPLFAGAMREDASQKRSGNDR